MTLEAAITDRLRAAGCVFAEDEAALLLGEFSGSALEAAVARRVAGEPLELVLGFVEFAGLRLAVAPGVFVPRRRTELVARLAIEALPPGGRLADLCCGIGAVAALVASRRPDAEVVAADVDPAAVAVASANLTPFGAAAVVSDMGTTLTGPFDVITACPPYVPTDEIALMPREARDYEPRQALDGGPDGTDLQAAVFATAAELLRPGGVVIVETSRAQAERTAQRAADAGLSRGVQFKASVGRDKKLGATVVVATLVSVTA